MAVLYKVNPHGIYALYYNGSTWKEGAIVRNEDVEQMNKAT